MMKSQIIYTLILCLCVHTTLVYGQTIDEAYWDGKVFLKIKNEESVKLPEFSKRSAATSKNYPILGELIDKFHIEKVERPFKLMKTRTFDNTYQVTFSDGQQAGKLISELEKHPEVEYVERIPIERLTYTPNDPIYKANEQKYLKTIQAEQAWDLSKGSKEVVIAVIDDGVKITHEDLKNNLWTNPGEIANNGIDDDNNGIIDDVNGVDLADNDGNPNPPSTATAIDFSHGTHVATIAAGETNNSKGGASLAHNVSLMAVKCTKDNATNTTLIQYGWPGVQYAIAKGADIINISWGGEGFSQTYKNMVDQAKAQGIVLIAAAGNSNVDKAFYPAAYESVMGVGSVGTGDVKSSFSNYGNWVNIVAPGSQIKAAIATGNTSYVYKSGTSMAAPVVASLAALMKSYNPAITPDVLMDAILETADNVYGANPAFVNKLGAGRINAYRALQYVMPEGCLAAYELDVTNLNANGATLTWKGVNGANGYELRYRKAGTSSWTTKSASGTSFNVNSLSTCTSYEYQVRTKCDGNENSNYSPTYTFEVPAQGPTGYCEARGGTANFEWIAGVKLGNTEYTSTSDQGYISNVCKGLSVSQGQNYTITLTPGHASAPYTEHWRVWIDFDQNGNFNGSNELVLNSNPSTTVVTGSIQIPATVKSGNTRIRVAMKWVGVGDDGPPSNCGTFAYGEVEDYLIEIGSGSVNNDTGNDTSPATCNAPSGLKSTGVGANSATLSWNTSSGSSGYDVQYKVGNGSWTTKSTSNAFYSLTNLNPNTTYQFRVKTKCNSNSSTYTSSKSFTTESAPCNTPAGLSAVNPTTNSVTAKWNSVSGANTYDIRYRQVGSNNWNTTTASTNQKNLTNLQPGISCEFQVRTSCASGTKSGYSSPKNFTTATPTCAKPSGLYTTNVSTSSATLKWNTVSGAKSYAVQYRKMGGSWTSLSATTNSKTISIDAGTSYEFRVKTNCQYNSSSYSSSEQFTSNAPTCNKPTNLSTSSVTTNSAKLRWSAASGASKYKVLYRKAGSSWSSERTANGTSYNVSNLAANTQYEFKVKTVCATNSSAYSSVKKFTTSAPACNKPTGLYATSIEANTATLKWSNATGANSYSIQYRKKSSAYWTSKSANSNSLNISGLAPDTQYEFKVKTNCSSNSSTYSTPKTFSTDELATCNTPSGASYSSLASSSVKLSCAAVSGANKYYFRYRKTGTTNWTEVSASTTYKTINGLQAATPYQFQIKAKCASGNSSYTNTKSFITKDAGSSCSPPTTLSASNVTNNNAVINWNKVSSANSYRLEIRKASTNNNWTYYNTSGQVKSLSNLNKGTTYEYRVRSVCGGSSSNFSDIETFTTTGGSTTACNSPTSLSIVNAGTDKATVSWSAVSGAGSYRVEFRKVTSNSWTSRTATNNSYTLTGLVACTDYIFRVKTVCSGKQSAFSSSKTFSTTGCSGGGNNNNYCDGRGLNANDEWIARVKFGNINNSSASNNGYGDYTSKSTDVNAGQNYSIQLTPGFKGKAYNEYWVVYIDFNGDGDFNDSKEKAFDAGSGKKEMVTGNISVPSNAKVGATRMRVAMQYGEAAEACEKFKYGEVEDYTINIQQGGGGNEPSGQDYCAVAGQKSEDEWIGYVSIAGMANSSGSNSGYGDFTHKTAEVSKGQTYTITLRPDFSGNSYKEYWAVGIDFNGDGDFKDANELAYKSTTGSKTQVTANINIPNNAAEGKTRMRVIMSYKSVVDFCSGFKYGEVEDYSLQIGAGNGTVAYCQSKGEDSGSEWIKRVRLEDLNNLSGSNGGYGDYTSKSTDLGLGKSYMINLEAGYKNKEYNEYWRVWIDYNQNGTFDANEKVYDSQEGKKGTVSGMINVPNSAKLGKTRMRVSMKYKEAPTPCEVFGHGEVEDYAIFITDGQGLASHNSNGKSSGPDNACGINIAFEYEVSDLAVQFQDYSEGEYDTFFWSFGDGETSDEANPIHEYPANGDYFFSVTLTNSNTGCSQMFTGFVHVFRQITNENIYKQDTDR